MNRRSFLKGILGVVTFVLCPLPLPKIKPQEDVVPYKGRSPFESGYIYCPYVPMQVIKGEYSYTPERNTSKRIYK